MFGGVTPIEFVKKQISLNPKNVDVTIQDIKNSVQNLSYLGDCLLYFDMILVEVEKQEMLDRVITN